MADVYNEETTGYVTLAFTDEDDVAVTPDSATYTLYDEASGSIINSRDKEVISSVTASYDLELEPDDNVIVSTSLDFNELEFHRLMVEWTYNTTKKGKDEYRFAVKNLTKVT